MRSYPRNSPEAAARIVALVLISDGHVSRSEYEALNQLDGARQLGLNPQDMPGIVKTLCEDLLMEGFDGRSILSHVGDSLVVSLMAEVDEPGLQGKVLRVAASVVQADKHLSDGEAAMLDAISRIWRIAPVTSMDKAGAEVPL
jgi:hypothetical protein